MKQTFLLKSNWIEIFNNLSDKQAGVLIKALYDYNVNGETPANLTDMEVKAYFNVMLLDCRAFNDKYDRRSITSAQNGKKGGRPPKNKEEEKPNKPTLKPNNLSKPYKDNDKDNDKDNVEEEERNFSLDPEIENRISLNSLKPLNEVFNELDNNQQWKEAICMNHNIQGNTVEIKLNNLQKLLNEFYNHLSGDMQVKEKSLQDTYSHFSNWLRKKKEYERK